MIDFASKGSNDVKSYPAQDGVSQSDEGDDDESSTTMTWIIFRCANAPL